jgi:hypothetical protein
MKKTLTTVLLTLSVLCVTSLVLASEKKAEVHHIHGVVTSVDATAKTVAVKETLKSGQTKDVTFMIGDKTKVTIQGKAGKLDDVKAGDAISVKYTTKGAMNNATEISIGAVETKKS